MGEGSGYSVGMNELTIEQQATCDELLEQLRKQYPDYEVNVVIREELEGGRYSMTKIEGNRIEMLISVVLFNYEVKVEDLTPNINMQLYGSGLNEMIVELYGEGQGHDEYEDYERILKGVLARRYDDVDIVRVMREEDFEPRWVMSVDGENTGIDVPIRWLKDYHWYDFTEGYKARLFNVCVDLIHKIGCWIREKVVRCDVCGGFGEDEEGVCEECEGFGEVEVVSAVDKVTRS
jgi:hypothetical protein